MADSAHSAAVDDISGIVLEETPPHVNSDSAHPHTAADGETKTAETVAPLGSGTTTAVAAAAGPSADDAVAAFYAKPYANVWCATWNVGNAQPPDDLRPWIPLHGEGFDIIVIGVQEATYKQKHAYPYQPGASEEAEVATMMSPLDSAMIPSTASHGGDGSGGETDTKTPEETLDLPFFNVVARHLGPSFVSVTSLAIWGIGLIVFVRQSLASLVADVAIKSEATGFMGITPNKGGIVAKLTFAGTRLCFVSSHLAAHLPNLEARNSNFAEIVSNVRISPINKNIDFDCGFDHVFWVGDLNYRCDMRLRFLKPAEAFANPAVPTAGALTNLKSMIDSSLWSKLMEIDQLKAAQVLGKAFVGFKEPIYAFPPTFKVKRVKGFVYNDEREPSYCDRVLWKSMPSLSANVECKVAATHESVFTSDHKPVSAQLRLYCPPRIKPATEAPQTEFPKLYITSLKGHNMYPADIKTSDPYIEFYCDVEGMLLGPVAGKTPRTTTKKSTLNPVWRDDEVPHMKLACRDVHTATRLNLIMLVMDYDFDQDDRMGQAVISISVPAKAEGTVPFTVNVTRNGQLAGKITGKIRLAWPGDADRRGSLVGFTGGGDGSCGKACTVM